MNNKQNKIAAADAITPPDDITENSLKADPKERIGTFIVINTRLQRGLRLNLDKIRTYAQAGEDGNVIQISYDNGGGTNLSFGSKKESDDVLAVLDSYCL